MNPLRNLVQKIKEQPKNHVEFIEGFVQNYDLPLVKGEQATFFFWDNSHADEVFLRHWVSGLESRQRFTRIPNTEAFFLTIELPYAARLEYKFEVRRGENHHWIRDPHNNQKAYDPFGANSVCAMPGYEKPMWSKDDERSRKGCLETFLLPNKAYGDEREITVYLPNEHRQRKNYPLLICHDGHDYRKYADIIPILDNLIHRHEVMPLIVAFTNGVHRNPEYGANPLQAQFIVEDLLPAMEERYSIASGSQNRGLMGASFGGVSCLYTAWKYPGVFERLLLQSGSFAFTDIGTHGRGPLWDPVVEFVNQLHKDTSSIRGRVFMSCGIFESLIYYNRSLAPLLHKEGVQLQYEESQDGHTWINWRDHLRKGLSWIYPGHLWMYYE